MLKSTGIFSSSQQTRKTRLLSVPPGPIVNKSIEIPKLIPIKAKRMWKSQPQKDFDTFLEGKK